MNSNYQLIGIAALTLATTGAIASGERMLVMDTGEVSSQSPSDYGRTTENAPAFRTVRGGTGITWRIQYIDILANSDRGFDHPQTGPAARAILERVLIDANNYIVSNATVDVQVLYTTLNGNFFVSGGTYYDSTIGVSDPDSMKVITTGINNYPDYPDIIFQLDESYNYNYTLAPPSPNEHDLYTKFFGALIRSLGVVTLSDANGSSTDINGYPTITRWDSFLETSDGTRLWSSSSGAFVGTPNWLTGGAGEILFDGPNATNRYGQRIPVYAPNPFQPGDSLISWGDSVTGASGLSSDDPIGSQSRTMRNWELGMLQDLGYSVTFPIPPKPEEWLIF